MKIAIATVQVPFIRGGAEMHAESLARVLRECGHTVELVMMPFRFRPHTQVLRAMAAWAAEDFASFQCGEIDKVICLRFPCYYLAHPAKEAWILHQHRAVYELFDTPYGGSAANPEDVALREAIRARDTAHLGALPRVYANSRRVSERLQAFNGVASQPLYHPPALAEQHYCGEPWSYIFYPSRLERLKRQELLIEAMAEVRSPVGAVIVGEGARRAALQQLIEALGLTDRVRLVGRVSEAEMLAWYAHALGVFFGPYDEDYGYITLEAMLSAKPVITCTDSGGPLEFVVDGETGWVVEPAAGPIAGAIEALYADRGRARAQGQAGWAHYRDLGLSWTRVVEALV